MKIKLIATIISLLLIAMLLTNVVLLFLWKHDALQRKTEHDQAVLAHIQSLLLHKKTAEQESATGEGEFAFSDFYESSEEGRFFLLPAAEKQSEQLGRQDVVKNNDPDDPIRALLVSAATEALNSGKTVSRTAAVLPGFLSCNDLLLNARPVVEQGKIIGAIAVVRSLDALFQNLWDAEKTVLGYLTVNLLVLGVIGFFRMAGLIIRPVDRLVALADQYHHDDPFRFVAEDSGSEFGKLSKSLNSMLARIEKDRQTLKYTVADLERANRSLKKQQQEMLRAEKLASVGRMAAGLAHEIGNPLAVVQGYLGMLLASKQQSEEHKDFLRRSEQEIQRIDKLIRQLLDFSRSGKGSPKIFSLHELLASVLDMIRMQTAFRDILLDADFAAQEDKVYADAEHLRQVFVNCLLNSADAVQQAKKMQRDRVEEKGRVSVATALQGRFPNDQGPGAAPSLLIRISDNGTGVTEQDLPVVFDPFYTTKEPGKGTGLGLSVSRSLVEAGGGTMELTGRAGQGSCMLISLPLASLNENDRTPGV